MSAKNRITINLDENKYQKLIELSNELDVSLAWLGRKAFTDLLAKYRRDGEGNKNGSVVSNSTNKLVGGS